MAKYWKITHLTIWWKGWRVTWSIVQKSRKFDLPYICPPAPLLPFLPDPRGRNSQANYEGKIGATCTRERNLFHLAGIFRQRPPGGHPTDRPVVISQRPIHSSLLLRPSWIKLNKRLNAFQGRKNLIDFMKTRRKIIYLFVEFILRTIFVLENIKKKTRDFVIMKGFNKIFICILVNFSKFQSKNNNRKFRE